MLCVRTQLKHIPRSTTDLQLLSAEMRSYMASGDVGWYHTVGMLTFVGCWKHAWSVPGAVVLVSSPLLSCPTWADEPLRTFSSGRCLTPSPLWLS